MSKHLLNDIVVHAKLNRKEAFKIPIEQKETQKIINVKDDEISTPKIKFRNPLWFIALFSVVFCFFAISFLFSSAKVIVHPKNEEVTLDEDLSASRDSSNNGLFFNLVIIPGEESKTIQATGEKDVSEKAMGSVIIYNTFSSSPQTLSIDTRLEGSNGKIYKTQTKTIVPGVNAKGVPGSMEVGIYANEAGASYNSGPLDFSIIGFKGSPKYEKFYARSKGNIVGGFIGKVPAVSDNDRASILTDLKTTLQAKLLKQAIDQVPSNFILFKDATFFDSRDTDISSTFIDNNSTLTLKGTLYGFIFDEQKLTKKIVKDNIEEYDDSDVFISNMKDLTFILVNRENVSFVDVQNINFNLSGQVKIFWRVDPDKFIVDLLGRSKKDFYQILSQYKNIDSATLNLSPMWRMSIPEKIKDIEVIVNYPE